MSKNLVSVQVVIPAKAGIFKTLFKNPSGVYPRATSGAGMTIKWIEPLFFFRSWKTAVELKK